MSTTTVTAGRNPRLARLAGRIRDAAEQLSSTAHAAGDAHARAQGWTITPLPGPAGLAGRAYRDPRFGTRRSRP